jgi:hypothetical protein
MSYQAYLDAIETKTGKTPQELLDEAASRGYGPETKATMVVDWLKEDYGVGRGHAMALFGVLKNQPSRESLTLRPWVGDTLGGS